MRISKSVITLPRMLASAALTACIVATGAASAETRLAVGITSNLSTVNPYGDSASHLYGLWGEVYGNLCRYDFK